MGMFKEPLLHFVVLGAALFGAYGWLSDGRENAEDAARTVHIRQADVDWIKGLWSRQWHREPTRDELRGLMSDYLKEELLAREARAMKLDENDIILRRRLAQKLSFIIEDAIDIAQPGDDDLQRLYVTHADRFLSDASITFTQIYFNPSTRKDLASDAASALDKLRRVGDAEDLSEMGDRLLVDSSFKDANQPTVSAAFGGEFARSVFALEPGGWVGPIRSGFGLHLVKIADMKKSEPLSFAAVRPQLVREWHREQGQLAHEKFVNELRRKYRVVADESVKPIIDLEPKKGSAAQ
jgi:PPIC-type PPIASE domain